MLSIILAKLIKMSKTVHAAKKEKWFFARVVLKTGLYNLFLPVFDEELGEKRNLPSAYNENKSSNNHGPVGKVPISKGYVSWLSANGRKLMSDRPWFRIQWVIC